MKKNLLVILLLVILIGVLYFQFKNKNQTPKVADSDSCYTLTKNKDEGSFAEYKLRLSVKDSNATGTLVFLQGGEGVKSGSIEGKVIKPSVDMRASRADLLWTAVTDTGTAKEELKIIFGDGTAAIGVGDMVLGEDGIYKYKSIPEIVYGLVLYETPCAE